MNNQNKSGQPTIGNYALLAAKKYGFAFSDALKIYEKKVEAKQKIIENMDEKPAPFKTILSCICIAIAVILGCIEGANVSTSLVGNGAFSGTMAFLVGSCFACIGLVTGELLSSGWKRDDFTGRRRPTARWWLGLLLTSIYVAGQFFLASSAGSGGIADMQFMVNTMTWFVLGISIVEVLFGALFLKNALQTFTVLGTNIYLKIIMWKMNKSSRLCEKWWLRYLFDVDTYNKEHETNISPAAETEAIQHAREFYNSGGFKEQQTNFSHS